MKKHTWIAAAALVASVSILGTACTKKTEVADTTPAQSQTEDTTASEEPTETESTGEEKEETGYYMLQGTVAKADAEGTVFSLQADDGQVYDISIEDIRDVEAEIKEGAQIVIGCVGAQEDGPEGSVMVVALPEQEEWTIATVQGTTTSNAMSTFVMETEDGRELSFLKDNCPTEEGALSGDSGDKLQVTYVDSQGMNFPLEIKSAE